MQERRRVLSGSSLPGVVNGSDAVALDVVFASNDGSLVQIIHGLENWPDSGWTPIGIVVVPGTHNRYGDGSCGVMSLVHMSITDPENGSTDNYSSIYFNMTSYGSGYNSVGGNIFRSSYCIDNKNWAYISGLTAHELWGCYTTSGYVWPYQGTITNIMHNALGDSYYTVNLTSNANTSYNNSNYATTGNACCDFNGVRNTAAIYLKSKNSTNWTSSQVSNYLADGYPAGACCGRFKTPGTNSFLDIYGNISTSSSYYGTTANNKPDKGFWYMPALGEITYVAAYFVDINNTLSALNQKYGQITVLIPSYGIPSSSEVLSDGEYPYIWAVDFRGFSVGTYSKDTTCTFRAFMRL